MLTLTEITLNLSCFTDFFSYFQKLNIEEDEGVVKKQSYPVSDVSDGTVTEVKDKQSSVGNLLLSVKCRPYLNYAGTYLDLPIFISKKKNMQIC